MIEINLLAVVVAAVAAFGVAALWYSPLLFGQAYMKLRGMNPNAATDTSLPLGEMLGEFVRNLVIAFVLAQFVARLGSASLIDAVQVGLWVWVGFQAMLLIGSVLHEKMPVQLYAIHAGDALAKTLLMAVILGVWR